jgi:DNA mismatch repair protein MutS2
MEDLLAALERKEKEVSALADFLAREKARVEKVRGALQEREEELKTRERTARARAEEEARRLLLDAREEVEEAIREVRRTLETSRADEEALAATHREARRKVEEAARRYRPGKPTESRIPGSGGGIQPGDRVSLSGTGSKGTVVEVREDRAVVEVSGVRLQLSAADLDFVGPHPADRTDPSALPSSRASSWQGPEAEAESELDLRGLRVSEIGMAMDRALDQAILAGLGEVRIIHGKGTGALRARVGELLSEDARVGGFRLGGPGEGGAGVTIVRLR